MSKKVFAVTGLLLVAAFGAGCGEQAGPGEVPAAAPQTDPDVEPARVPEPLLTDTVEAP